MTISEIGILILAIIGVGFLAISTIGLLRLPDVFTRMHAAGKAATLGVGALLFSAGFFFETQHVVRTVLLLLLFFITAPIATTAMARASYRELDTDEKFLLAYDEMADDRRNASQAGGQDDDEARR